MAVLDRPATDEQLSAVVIERERLDALRKMTDPPHEFPGGRVPDRHLLIAANGDFFSTVS